MTIKQAMSTEKEIDIFEVKMVMQFVLNMSNSELIANMNTEMSKEKQKEFEDYIKEIKSGKPLQYITNSQEFMGENFYVNDNVLIPQPDTEIVVEQAVKIINELASFDEKESQVNVLDLCTGSGAIAICIKKILKDLVCVTASDISPKALEVAKINSNNLLKHNETIKLIESDMFNNIKGKFDVIVSNPPYIETKTIQTLPKDVQNEPFIALDGGEDGLYFYKIIRKNANKFLNKNGYLILEIGYNQKNSLFELFENAKCIKDYSGNNRVIIWKNSDF